MTEAQNFCCPDKYYSNKKIPFWKDRMSSVEQYCIHRSKHADICPSTQNTATCNSISN